MTVETTTGLRTPLGTVSPVGPMFGPALLRNPAFEGSLRPLASGVGLLITEASGLAGSPNTSTKTQNAQKQIKGYMSFTASSFASLFLSYLLTNHTFVGTFWSSQLDPEEPEDQDYLTQCGCLGLWVFFLVKHLYHCSRIHVTNVSSLAILKSITQRH